METVRNTRLLDVFVAEWHRLTKLHLPRKLKILQLVENLNKERIKKQLLEVIKGWWRVSAGPESGRCGGVVLGWGKGGGSGGQPPCGLWRDLLTRMGLHPLLVGNQGHSEEDAGQEPRLAAQAPDAGHHGQTQVRP